MDFMNKYINKSIKRQTLLYLMIAFIIMFSFILIITQKYSKSHFYSLAENNYALSIESEKDFLNNYVVEQTKSMNDFIKKTEWNLERATSAGINEDTWFSDYLIFEDLKFFYENNSRFYEQVFFVTPNLEMYTYSDLFELDLPVKINKEQYQAASKNDLSIISQGRISRYSGQPIFTITKGVKHNEKIIGIIGGTIDLKELSREFKNIIKEKPGDTYIIRDGKYIVHNDPLMILEDVDFDCSSIEGEKGLFSISDNKVFFTKTQGVFDGYLVSQIPNSSLYGDIDKYMLILLLMLIASLAVVIGLSYIAVKKFTEPIISLKDAMDRATDGDFFAKAEKNTVDELGQAMDSFNILMERIRTLTFFDKLTQIPNYEQFKYWFNQETKNKDKEEESYSFILTSINGFKKINETYGVEAGDQVIIQVARRLEKAQKRFSKPLFLCRFSGDEFLLFYKNIENKIALEEELLMLLRQLNSPYLYQGTSIHLRFVIGGSFCEECYSNLDFQISAVSNARSIAKKERKEFFIIGNKDNILDSLVEIKSLENELHSALAKKELMVYYQPIYNVSDESFLSVEALVRYNHPERGIISPIEFIPLAEEIGIIDKIDKFVLEETLKDMKDLEIKGYEKLEVHVNISPSHMINDNFTNEILEIPKKYNFSNHRLWLEITEDIALYNLEQQEQTLLELKKSGLRISIDDFGTGYSSFLYLNQLSADQIKIDKSFVMNMKKNKRDYEIVKTIITLAQSLNIDLVTEGVEDKESYEILKGLGVNKMQGYYFAKPMDIENFEKFLAEHKK